MDKDRETKETFSNDDLAKLQERYSDIATDTENHTRSDYRLAMLEMDNDYFISGLPRLRQYLFAHADRFAAYVVPMMMIMFEVVFITDMIGATNVLTPYFNGNTIAGSR